MAPERTVVLELGKHRARAGFSDESRPRIDIPAVIGYIKEMSPHSPLVVQEQLHGRWIGNDLDKIKERVEPQLVDIIQFPPDYQAIADFLKELTSRVWTIDTRACPWFVSLDERCDEGFLRKLAEILFEMLEVPALCITRVNLMNRFPEKYRQAHWDESPGLEVSRWREYAFLTRQEWMARLACNRETYDEQGPDAVEFLDDAVVDALNGGKTLDP